MSIYKPCDIRGDAAKELSPELYRSWGRTLGGWLRPADKFVVGGDIRESTPPFLDALVQGLCSARLDVVNLGQLPTPMVYHALRRLNAAGCAVVTASHNPARFNGLKWLLGDEPPTPEQVESMRRGASDQQPPADDGTPSEPRFIDTSFDYVATLQERWVDCLSAQGHYILDPMYGCFAARARRYLHAVFPQCLFETIHDEPRGDFGGRSPDCSRQSNLNQLCDAVETSRADCGIAFDGDGDRIALVDNEGIPLSAEETTWILLQSFGDALRGQSFVYDQKLSHHIVGAARELGAEPLVERSGHSFLRQRMRQTGALFGAEISGHYFFRELEGNDDALFTACWLLSYLARTQQSLADLRRQCPPTFVSPDLRMPLPPQRQGEVIERLRDAWSEYPQHTLDGLRVETPDGWILVRPSVTEAALTFRFESDGWEQLDDLVDRFCDTLGDLGDDLFERYHQVQQVSDNPS